MIYLVRYLFSKPGNSFGSHEIEFEYMPSKKEIEEKFSSSLGFNGQKLEYFSITPMSADEHKSYKE